MLHHPVHGRDHLGDVDRTVGRTDLDRRELRIGCQAGGPGGGVVADDDPGHVGAMAVRVEVAQRRRLRLQRQVRPVHDARRGPPGDWD